MRLSVGAHGPIPVCSQLTDQLKHVIEGGGFPRSPARPSIREMVGGLGSNPNPAARAIEDLKRSGYRPLRLAQRRLEPSSIPGAATVNGRHALRRQRGRDAGEP
jgi:hypothetical protein